MNYRTKYLLMFIVWVLLIIALAAISLAAEAAKLRGEHESCVVVGHVIVQAGDMRDNGVPWETAQIRFKELLDDARNNPASFVQNDEDAEFIMKAFKRLWDDPKQPSFIVATEVYRQCMGSINKVRRKVT